MSRCINDYEKRFGFKPPIDMLRLVSVDEFIRRVDEAVEKGEPLSGRPGHTGTLEIPPTRGN